MTYLSFAKDLARELLLALWEAYRNRRRKPWRTKDRPIPSWPADLDRPEFDA